MWTDILKNNRQAIDEYVKNTKQGLYDMLSPTWEEDPMLLRNILKRCLLN